MKLFNLFRRKDKAAGNAAANDNANGQAEISQNTEISRQARNDVNRAEISRQARNDVNRAEISRQARNDNEGQARNDGMKNDGMRAVKTVSKAKAGVVATLATAIAACVACAFVAIFGGTFINNDDFINDAGSSSNVAEAATYTSWKAASDASAFTSGANVVINLAANLTAVTDTTYGTTFGNAGTTYTSLTNNKGYYYGALLVPTGCTVTLNLGTYTVDRALTAAKAYGSVIVVNGSLTVQGTTGKIYRGFTTTNGGGVLVNSGGTLFWNGGTIDTCKASGNGGGIYSAKGAVEFRINNNTATHIQNCVASGDGGGVYADGNSNLIYNCNIHNNTAKNGGGITFGPNMATGSVTGNTNTKIYSNKATANGGGVYIAPQTLYDVTMDYGQIYSNTAVNGGGVYVQGRATIRYNQRIFKNTASTDGGGVYVHADGYCLIRRDQGNISYIYANTATNNGGGVWTDGQTYIQGASIGYGYKDDLSGYEARANTAKNGGGVYASTNTYLRLEGGRIEYNTATVQGAGVYWGGGTETSTAAAHPVNGNTWRGRLDINSYYSATYIRNNTLNGGANNLYMPTGKTFRIVENLNRSGAYIGITTQTKPTGVAGASSGMVQLTAATYTTSYSDAKNHFFSDASGYSLYSTGAGAHLYLCTTGGVNANTDATGKVYDSWAAASSANAFASGKTVRVNLQEDLNATTGDTNYTSTFGTKNTVYNSTTDTKGYYHGALLVPAGCTVYLSLGEQDIDRKLTAARAEGYIILVYGRLYITGVDNQLYSILRGGYNSGDGGAIRIESGGFVEAKGIHFKGNHAANGGAIHVGGGGTFTHQWGYMRENVATTNGGAINNAGTLNIYNGEFGSLTAGYGNSAKNGGAIYNTGTTTLQGGKIKNNSASTAAGGIYQGGTLNLNTYSAVLEVKDNLVGTAQQNLYLPNGKQFVISNNITRADCLVGIYNQTAPTGASASGTQICAAYTASLGSLTNFLKSDQGKGIYQSAAGAIGYHSASGGSNKADSTVVSFTSWAAASAALAFKSGNTVNITLAANLTATAATGALLSRGVHRTFNAADTATCGSQTTTASKSSTNWGNQAGYAYGSLVVPYGCTVNLNMQGYTINRNCPTTLAYEQCGYAITVRGSLVITGTTSAKITGCNTKGSGAVDVNDYGYLKVSNIQITGNTVRDSGGAIANHSSNAKIELNNCSLTNNKCVLGSGGGLYTCGTTIITSCTITGNTAYNRGGGIYFNSAMPSTVTGTSAALTKIESNKTTGNGTANTEGGGGVSINAATVDFTYTSIKSNVTHNCGGGINLCGSGTMTLGTGVTVQSNTATSGSGNGGGVVSQRNWTMNAGATITGNSAKYGGGVYVVSYTFTMNNGTISNNTATTTNGGGVYNWGGTFNMNNGTISGNSAANSGGGGVFNQGTSTFTMNNGTISGNTAKNGGGIYNQGTTNLCGGTIQNNTATNNGGGFYVEKGTAKINTSKAKVTVYDNKKGTAQNNVFLPSGVYITISASMATTAGSKIGITTATAPGADNYTNKGIKVINAYNGSSYGSCTTYFVSDLGTGFNIYCDSPTSTTAATGYHAFTYTKLTKTAWATSLTTSTTYNALTYNKAAQTAALNSTIDNTNAITATLPSGVTFNSAKNGLTATNAGTYTITFVPKAHYCWASESDRATVTLTYTIKKKDIAVTWTNTSLEFNGSARKPTAEVKAHATATNAGTYITGDTVTVSVTTHTSATAASANAIVPATYVAKATLGGTSAGNYQITTATASISDFTITKMALAVTWTNTSPTYNGAAQLPTATATGVNTTYPATLTVAKTAGDNVNVGTFTAKATLSTASAAWYTLTSATESNANCKIVARSLGTGTTTPETDITVAALSALTYTGSAQTPLPVVKYGTKTLTKDTDYTLAYTANTNASTTAPTVTITGKGNYSGSVQAKFTINKAQLTLTAPTSTPTTDKIYVGQQLSAVTLTGGSAVNKTTTSVTVAGTFSWSAPTTKITKTMTTAVAKFTPTDTANYDYSAATINVAIAPTQLTVSVAEVAKGATAPSAAVSYDVDYNSTFTFDTGITQTLTEPAGYSTHYYSDAACTTEYLTSGSAATGIANIQADKHVYVGYKAEEVNYTVYYIKQTKALSAATAAQVTNSGANLTDLLTEKVEKQATADTRVSVTGADLLEYDGFTLTQQLSADLVSDYTNKLINGDGSTYFIIYYARNQYTVSWVANGGSLDTYSTKVYYECAPSTEELGKPTRTGYGFDYWCVNNNAANDNGVDQADLTQGITQNTTFYAKWGAITYTLTLRPGTFEIGYQIDPIEFGEGETYAHNPSKYTIDDLPLTLKNPTAVGYVFAGWKDADGNIVNKITYATADDMDLTAQWTPAKFTVRFNANGGTVRRSSMTVTNFDKFTNIGTEDTTAPTRDGFKFVGWYTEAVDGTPYDNGDPIRLKATMTLYAHWAAIEYSIAYNPDLEQHWDVGGITVTKDGEPITWETDTVVKGDKITVKAEPHAGYEIVEIKVAGTRIANGGAFTVKSRYTNDEISVEVTVQAKNYTLVYNRNGGTIVNTQAFPQSYNLSMEPIILSDAVEDIARTGYKFVNWEYLTADGEREVLEDYEISGLIFPTEGGDNDYCIDPTASSIELYATWEADYVTLELHNNFERASENLKDVVDIRVNRHKTEEVVALNPETINVTGATSFIPTNREFIGWATSPTGAVEYPVTYITDDEGNIVPNMVINYTMLPEGNTLYAKWRIANAQYLIITADNNNMEFSTAAGFNGVTLTAVPRYAYKADSSTNLEYQWYRVTGRNVLLDEEGEYILFDENNNNQLVNGVLAIGEPIKFTADKQVPITLNIKNVADSGNYVCVLKAEGTNISVGGGMEVTATGGQGQFLAVIKKATYKNMKLEDIVAKYDGTSHNGIHEDGSRLTFSDSVNINLENSTFTLGDGTIIKVAYEYKNQGGKTIDETELVRAGSYTLTASFTFADDKGNYNLPEAITASIKVNKVTINNIEFEMQQLNEAGDWVRLEDSHNVALFEAAYTGKQFRIVVKSRDIIEADKNNVVVELSDGVQTAVGDYEALLSGVISGTNSDNYQLGVDTAALTQVYSIVKATHEVKWEFNGNDTDVYNNEAKLIAISFKDGATKLPDGVKVNYSVVYVPFNGAFNAPANNVVINTNAAGDEISVGGVNAGTYTITADFDDANIANYNPIAPLTATLVINKANYKLSDEELQTSLGKQGFGYVGDYTEAYNVDTNVKYKPQLKLDSAHFAVTYNYERLNKVTNQYTPFTVGDGFRETGTYRITASVSYVSEIYKNNYNDVADNTSNKLVIDFVITPGKVRQIIIEYSGDTTIYKYGDKFDFARKIVVKVEYDLKDANDNYQTEIVPFGEYEAYAEKKAGATEAEIFERFDRASANGDKDYEITISCYDTTKVFKVAVEQADFDISALSFLASEITNNAYTVTYDAAAHKPTIANAANGYGIKGILDNDVVDADFQANYEVAPASDPTNFAAMPANGITTAGTYVIRVYFTHSNANFKAIEQSAAFAKLTCNARIAAKTVSKVTWQYENAEGNFVDIPKDESGAYDLEYKGGAYNIRAAFNGEGSDGLITSATVTVSGMGSAVENAGAYTLKAELSGNYAVNVSEAFTLKGKSVTAKWVVVENGVEIPVSDYTFVYNGTDRIDDIKVYYIDVNSRVVALNITNAANVNFKDVKEYTISANQTSDANYNVQDISNVKVEMVRKEISTVSRWEYQDLEGNWQEITGGSLEYKGTAYNVRAVFAGAGSDGEMTAAAKAASGDSLTNVSAAAYGIVVGESGNYDVTAATNLVITKKTVTVAWNYDEENSPLIYSGGLQTVGAVAKGVGAEVNDTIVDLSDNIKQAANTADEAMYTATASLKAAYVDNYVLANSSLNWKIFPKPVTFSWESKALTYNGAAQQITAKASGMFGIDTVTLTYTITGDEVNANGESVNAGSYTITVTGVSDSNYTPDTEGTQTTTYIIDKATPVVSGVVYSEYSEANTTYENRTLRNDKIEYTATVDSVPVAGGMIFSGNEGENGIKVGQESNGETHAWEFRPTDSKNYNNVFGSLTLKVLKDTMDRLEFDTNTTQFYKRQRAGSIFSFVGLKAYIRYTSYYTETTEAGGTSTTVEYGKSESIGQSLFNTALRFTLIYTNDEGESQSEDALSTTLRLMGDEPAETQTINVMHNTLTDAAGDYLVGDFSITVARTDFTVAVKDTSAVKMEYYAGERFDPIGLLLEITYEASTSGGTPTTSDLTVTASTPDISRGNALTVGNTIARFTYGGKEVQVTGITVKPTEALALDYKNISVLAKDVKDFALPEITLANGNPLPEGVTPTYTITYDGEEVTTFNDKGDYTVNVSFVVTNPRYSQISPISYTVSVIDKLAYTVVANKPDDTSFVYDGNGKAYQLKSYQITDEDGLVVNDITVTYEILRDGIKVNDVKDAGNYTITVKYGNIGDSYAAIPDDSYIIDVAKADNTITAFSLESWVAGEAPKTPTVTAAGGVAGAQFSYSATEEGTFTADVPTEAGTYFVKVMIPSTANFNAVVKTTSFVINKPAIASEDGKVEFTPPEGINPDATIEKEDLPDGGLDQYKEDGKTPVDGFDLTLNGDTLEANESVTVSIKVDEKDRDKKLKVYKVDGNGQLQDMNATREGDTLTFTTTDVNGTRYILMETEDGASAENPPSNPGDNTENPGEENPTKPGDDNPTNPGDNTDNKTEDNGEGGLIAGVTIGAIVVVILVIIVIVVFVKKKKRG